jgi:ribosomal small subunit protein bTHX
MGKGDKRSFKGKVFKGSHGKTRPRHKAKAAAGASGGASQGKKK